MSLLRVRIMSTAIQFNSQGRLSAVKIKNVTGQRMLSTKFKTTKPASPQNVPEKNLGVGLLPTQFFGENEKFRRYGHLFPSVNS